MILKINTTRYCILWLEMQAGSSFYFQNCQQASIKCPIHSKSTSKHSSSGIFAYCSQCPIIWITKKVILRQVIEFSSENRILTIIHADQNCWHLSTRRSSFYIKYGLVIVIYNRYWLRTLYSKIILCILLQISLFQQTLSLYHIADYYFFIIWIIL